MTICIPWLVCLLLVAFAAPVHAQQKAAARDVSKIAIERPTEELAARSSRESLKAQLAEKATAAVNPSVEPGRVRWHSDFAAACAASRQSGKPVLLFQLLGRLDQRFT